MSAFWIVRLGMAGVIFFALKAAWHWQASTVVLTRADIAGLLDARSAMGVVAESALDDGVVHEASQLMSQVANPSGNPEAALERLARLGEPVGPQLRAFG